MPKTILIMAGGTGGHVFPGIAVANELSARGWQVHWLGTPKRMEAQLVPKAGFEISFIDVEGVRGNGVLRILAAPFKILQAIWAAYRVIRQVKPDVVLGMGGFASGPGGIAAWLRGIPLVVHEQNAIPGLTNKWLSKIANRVLCGFNNGFEQLQSEQKKYHWVGNPVRKDFMQIANKQAHDSALKILIVGGSLGAKALNEHVPLALSQCVNLEVKHQCGKGHVDDVNARYQTSLGDKYNWQVVEFIDDMASAYDWADIVICRAGALTVAEVAMAGVVAIFVPLPHAVDDHQTLNAKALSDANAAYLLPQSELQQGELSNLLNQVISEPQKRIDVGAKARTLAKPQATESVSDICEQLGGMAA